MIPKKRHFIILFCFIVYYLTSMVTADASPVMPPVPLYLISNTPTTSPLFALDNAPAAADILSPVTVTVGCPGTFTLNEVTLPVTSNKKSGQSTRTVCPAKPLAGICKLVLFAMCALAGGTGLIRNSFLPETVLPVDVVADAVNVTVPLPADGLNMYLPLEPLNPGTEAVMWIAPSAPFAVAEIGFSSPR